jgi:hypothetical protein
MRVRMRVRVRVRLQMDPVWLKHNNKTSLRSLLSSIILHTSLLSSPLRSSPLFYSAACRALSLCVRQSESAVQESCCEEEIFSERVLRLAERESASLPVSVLLPVEIQQ